MDGPETRRRRKLLGMTVAELADRVGITPAYVRHIEIGIRHPSPPIFARICDALGVEDRNELLADRSAS